MVYTNRRCHGVRRCVRRTLVRLPEDTLLLLLQYLPVVDLCKMRLVCNRFNNLILNSPCLWVHTSFSSVWPSPDNFPVFQRASDTGNIEAIIKMGISYLYNEGVSQNGSKRISLADNEKNAIKAAMYFCKAEEVTSQTVAFIWSFIRPPWAAGSMCCKRHVFNSIVNYCTKFEDADPSILFSLGKVLYLQEDDAEDSKSRANVWLERAAERGSSLAKFELWKQKTKCNNDPAVKIQELRELRECLMGNKEAELELVMNYATGNIGNLDRGMATEAIRQFLASSVPCGRSKIFQFQIDLNRRMRYILVDWLIEVTSMKDFSGHVLHAAVWYVDQYLLRRKMNRSQLQLLGIGCMLIASRFYGEDIVTIRESSWLTDNTYTYEQVVRMIGEIMGCLRGETQVLTIPNYVQLFCKLIKAERKVENFAFYIADMAVLRPIYESYSFAVTALSCTLLGKLICYPESVWCSDIEIFLPFEKHTVLSCMNFVFEKCIKKDSAMDQNLGILKAVKERYILPQFSEVSKMKIPSKDEMKELLRRFSPLEDTTGAFDEEATLNTTFCSTTSSGYDGDEEDMGDIEDSDEDEMMWYEDDCVQEQGTKTGQKMEVAVEDEAPVLDTDQIERSTPSFLSPGWLQSVVAHHTPLQTARTRSLGSNERREGVSRVQYHSLGAVDSPSAVHSRRPLVDVNNRLQCSTSGKAGTRRIPILFKPIDRNTPENLNN